MAVYKNEFKVIFLSNREFSEEEYENLAETIEEGIESDFFGSELVPLISASHISQNEIPEEDVKDLVVSMGYMPETADIFNS